MGIKVGDVIKGCEILERLDQGGMGTVYRAHQRSLQRDVVVKVLHDELVTDEEFVKRFYREAQAAARLQHPNIVAVLDTGTVDGAHLIVMEYVAGTSVERLIAEHGCLGVARALAIVEGAALGLAAAHAAGIVHRDIKPGNLLVAEDGTVKLADFGIAKVLGDDLTRLTQTDVMVGTLQYASPEQFDGRPIDGRTDIYSLGITLYHMLVGARPFDGRNTLALIQRAMKEIPPPPHTRNALIPEPVSQLVERMIAKSPDDRVESAERLVLAVRSLQKALGYTREGGNTELRRLGIEAGAPAKGGPPLWLLGAGLALALGAGALGWALSLWLSQ